MSRSRDSKQRAIRVDTRKEGDVVRRLEVQVDAQIARKAYDRAYRDLARRAHVRGFRPGKAPRSVLERLYGPSLDEQIGQTLVAETLRDALEQAGLEPVTQPEIDAPPPTYGEAFRYSARIEVKPELSLPEVRGLPARRPRVEVSDDDVVRELEALRRRSAPMLEEPEGVAVGEEHILSIDFDGRVGGEPFEGGSGKGVELEMGSNRFPPGFEEQLLGAQCGELREVRVRFPEDYGSRELAGKEALFQVQVVAIKHRHLPKLDDEFAKDQGDFETLDALRERIRSELTAARERSAQAELRRTLMDALIERTRFEVPLGLVEGELERQLSRARRQLERAVSGELLEAQLSRWREEWRTRAERQVREGLLLAAVAAAEAITADDAELEARIEQMASEGAVDPAALRKAYREGSLRDALRDQLVEEKALDLLCREAKVEETPGS